MATAETRFSAMNRLRRKLIRAQKARIEAISDAARLRHDRRIAQAAAEIDRLRYDSARFGTGPAHPA